MVIGGRERRAVALRQLARAGERQARDPENAHARVARERRGMVAAHDPGADDADAERGFAMGGQGSGS